jgi:hypothetical protein
VGNNFFRHFGLFGFDRQWRLSNDFHSSVHSVHLDLAVSGFGFNSLHGGSFKKWNTA